MPSNLQDFINRQHGLPIEFGASVQGTTWVKGYFTRSDVATFQYKLSDKKTKN